jgi:hypothetical protein
MGNGSPLAAMLVIRHGSRCGSTSLSGVTLVKGIHQGKGRDTDAAHGVVPLTAVALPWTTSASEVVSAAWIQPTELRIP